MAKNKNIYITQGLDGALLWLYFILVFIGLTAIFAVTYKDGDPIVQNFLQFKTDYSKQLYFFILSLILGLLIVLTDSKFFSATANLWYLFGLFTLLLVFPFHARIKGTESIIRIGSLNFQPADFCKLFVALALSKYLSRSETIFSKTSAQIIAAIITFIPAVLSIFQHELGLALVYFSFLFVMYREGLPPLILIVGFAIAALVVATLLLNKFMLASIITVLTGLYIIYNLKQINRNNLGWVKVIGIWAICVSIQLIAVPFAFKNMLGFYQVERIYTTLGKEVPVEYIRTNTNSDVKRKKDPGYNVKQSKIAIGSGRLFGKGLLKGTQTRNDFVPEQRTDFIFCTIGEGFGFAGSMLLLIVYVLMLFRIITIAERQRSTFSRSYAYCVASVLFFHCMINILMTVGLAPVIGISLPFLSYGGTSLITFSIMIFILLKLDSERQMSLR